MIFELQKKVLLYWKFAAAALFAAVFSALWFILSGYPRPRLVLCLVCAGIFVLFVFVYLPLRFKCTCVSVADGRISCRKGVIISREYFYPNARLVYIQRVRLPLASCFGLQVLVLRGVGHSLILPPLTEAQVLNFRKAVESVE